MSYIVMSLDLERSFGCRMGHPAPLTQESVSDSGYTEEVLRWPHQDSPRNSRVNLEERSNTCCGEV
jgi:hypothetical protein